MIRKFVLINDNGERLQLNDLDTFGHSPEGLGLSFTHEYYGANGNFIPNGSGVEQQTFTIQVLLGAEDGRHYERFSELAGFLNYPPYAIEYTTDAGSWLRDAQLKSMDKSELNEWSVIDSKLEFEFFTPWYRWIIGGSNVTESDGQKRGKIYLNNTESTNRGYYTYGYTYGNDIDNTSGDGYFTITNSSQYFGVSTGSPVEISIHGPAGNPNWDVFQDSKLIQSDGFFLSVPDGYTLIVSSVPQNQRAVMIGPNNEVVNVYQSQDLTKSNFITVPRGQSTIYIESGGSDFSWRVREERLVV